MAKRRALLSLFSKPLRTEALAERSCLAVPMYQLMAYLIVVYVNIFGRDSARRLNSSMMNEKKKKPWTGVYG
jgi:hypothetical protein